MEEGLSVVQDWNSSETAVEGSTFSSQVVSNGSKFQVVMIAMGFLAPIVGVLFTDSLSDCFLCNSAWGASKNGDTYAGEYFADKMHGFGVYRFANGHRYEGAWHEGRRQGLGMYTFRNGETQSGHWQNGVLDIPSTQNTTFPVSPVGVYHSKVLNAVQEARRAAERAYDVAKVDEGVNRAVAASNRAANQLE
ncbi:hypothetical protein Fmac_028202 [Flemingia macrophylla]|uniref:Uncharacterized protein n=1 Tax=Flemingia macrophylla TaxID=520843 RepID=A0ABD1L7A0_9FABA